MLLLLLTLALTVKHLSAATTPWLPDERADHDFDPLTPPDLLPNIISQSSVITTRKGKNVTLFCDVVRLGNYSVIWLKESTLLWVMQGSVTAPHVQHVSNNNRIGYVNTSLHIRDVRPSDEGEYRCEVSHDIERSIRHRLIVNVPASVRPKKGANFVQGQAGETVELECQVRGKPKPEIHWKRMDRHEIAGVASDALLTIANVTPADAGIYSCVASNGIGNPDMANITLHVQYPPAATALQNVVHTGLTYEATLSCYVDASPFPKVDWFIEGSPINLLRIKKVIEKKKKFSLFFQQVFVEDFGFYSCNASNYWGNDSAVVELTGRPMAPRVTSHPQGQYQDNYTLTWEVKSYAPVTKYVVFLKNASTDPTIDEEEWLTLNAPGSPSSSMFHSQGLALHDLPPGATYLAMVQAYNEFGQSEYSPVFTFTIFDGESITEEEISMQTSVKKLEGSSDQQTNGLYENYTLQEFTSLLSKTNDSNITNSLLKLMQDEGTQNVSSVGVPSMTAWEKRTQLMSMVTAVSLSCFFYYFAMR